MRIILEIPDDYIPADGDAFDAVESALNHFEIPANLTVEESPIESDDGSA